MSGSLLAHLEGQRAVAVARGAFDAGQVDAGGAVIQAVGVALLGRGIDGAEQADYLRRGLGGGLVQRSGIAGGPGRGGHGLADDVAFGAAFGIQHGEAGCTWPAARVAVTASCQSPGVEGRA